MHLRSYPNKLDYLNAITCYPVFPPANIYYKCIHAWCA